MSPKDLSSKFAEFITNKKLATSTDKVLLAVSGGIDSMVMLTLFASSQLQFGVAHCNFQLRGKESDEDMEFVQAKANQMGVPFIAKKFDAEQYARTEKLSIQESARNLRYSWFEKVAVNNGFSLVATAHNLNDSAETLLINLARGTGIRGLAGIPVKNGKVIRPLLFATRSQIEEYANENAVEFRTDSSNLDEKYLRNRLRHNVIPVMESCSPNFFDFLKDFFLRINESLAIIDREVAVQRIACMEKTTKGFEIDIGKLLQHVSPRLLLHEFLKDLGFNPTVCSNLFGSLSGQPGKIFLSQTHRAIKDRTKIIVEPIKTPCQASIILVDEATSVVEVGGQVFSFASKPFKKGDKIPDDPNVAFLDKRKLKFPLELRKILAGDTMVPLGMTGKKKISDILIDEKIPLHEKERTLVVVSENQIVWLVGLRVSQKVKVTSKTNEVLEIVSSYIEDYK